jgi:hypothetical protein
MSGHPSLVVFVVSLLIGGIGIWVGARLFAGASSYAYAVVTAGLGALVWGLMSYLFGGSLIGPVVTLLAYLAVIKWRYRTDWITAAGIALVGWISALVVLGALASVGVGSFRAIGIPNT